MFNSDKTYFVLCHAHEEFIQTWLFTYARDTHRLTDELESTMQ